MDSKGPKPIWEENRNDAGHSGFPDTLRAAVNRAQFIREAKEAAVFILFLAAGLALAIGVVILTAITLGHAV